MAEAEVDRKLCHCFFPDLALGSFPQLGSSLCPTFCSCASAAQGFHTNLNHLSTILPSLLYSSLCPTLTSGSSAEAQWSVLQCYITSWWGSEREKEKKGDTNWRTNWPHPAQQGYIYIFIYSTLSCACVCVCVSAFVCKGRGSKGRKGSIDWRKMGQKSLLASRHFLLCLDVIPRVFFSWFTQIAAQAHCLTIASLPFNCFSSFLHFIESLHLFALHLFMGQHPSYPAWDICLHFPPRQPSPVHSFLAI